MTAVASSTTGVSAATPTGVTASTASAVVATTSAATEMSTTSAWSMAAAETGRSARTPAVARHSARPSVARGATATVAAI